jgi:hypothetical protein
MVDQTIPGIRSGEHTPGPYWISTETNGSHVIKGRYGKVLFTYRADQISLADAHCRRLQKRHEADEQALYKAAPELLEALIKTEASLVTVYTAMARGDAKAGERFAGRDPAVIAARAAIAKASPTPSSEVRHGPR